VPDEIDIRGEVYMDTDEFEKLNRQRKKTASPLCKPETPLPGL
jgi:NAD-dependent DNA ligase